MFGQTSGCPMPCGQRCFAEHSNYDRRAPPYAPSRRLSRQCSAGHLPVGHTRPHDTVLRSARDGHLFYVTGLGAVLLGIGIALWIERRNQDRWRGLGLAGAVIINVLGAGTVLVWLLLDPFDIPTRGYVVLWSVTIIVLGTGLLELTAILRHGSR